MRDGDGGGRLEFRADCPALFHDIVGCFTRRTFGGGRSPRDLQSEAVIPFRLQPIDGRTCPVPLPRSTRTREGFIGCAVATGNDSDHCGFLVSAIHDGELAALLDGDAGVVAKRVQVHPGPVVLCRRDFPWQR